jgi:hypothetical protein
LPYIVLKCEKKIESKKSFEGDTLIEVGKSHKELTSLKEKANNY